MANNAKTIEAATEAETEALIIAHEATIFTIVCECWNAQVEKIQGNRIIPAVIRITSSSYDLPQQNTQQRYEDHR